MRIAVAGPVDHGPRLDDARTDANVRVGSIASFWPCADHSRSSPDKQTFRQSAGASQRCQQETHAPQQTPLLFDHLIGDGEHRWRHLNAERPSRPQIDDELKIWLTAPPTSHTTRNVDSALGPLAGLMSTATRMALGTRSRRSRICLATTSLVKILMPVALPPCRARPATRPRRTGSSGP
jgi:hypothetical protein